MSNTSKITFVAKVAKSSKRLLITIPSQLRPLINTEKTYKVTLEEVTSE